MWSINLNKTKKKLTVVFALLILWSAILLEWIFLTTKYYITTIHNWGMQIETHVWSDTWMKMKDISTQMILILLFLAILLSILFYYIWSKFVSKNLEPVEKTLDDMQSFIHNAWHELKTPISIVLSNLQLMREIKKYDEKMINEGINEVYKLDGLIEWLIELSDIQVSNNDILLNINNEIKNIIKDFNLKVTEKEINVDLIENWNLTRKINKQYFYILFSNIFSNAIRYNKIWWSIIITINKDNIIIKDTWIWINEKHKDKLFDRFFMVDSSRNSEWHWIWLSLVKKIIDIYDIKIDINSVEWEGSEFVLKF
jgi:two-component system OmpR family sensor kinase